MDHAQKMYLVPKRELDMLKSTSVVKPDIRQTVTQRLDTEISEILYKNDLPDDEKIKRYTAILQRYLALTRQDARDLSTLNLITPPAQIQTPMPSSADTTVQDILMHVHDRFKKNAEVLLSKMKHANDITDWNDRGEFVYRGNAVPGSNILDLVRTATQNHGVLNKSAPHGWGTFVQSMAELNIPSTVVGNSSNRKLLDNLKMQMFDDTTRTATKQRLYAPPSPGITQGSLLPKKRGLPLLQTAWLTL